jgi:hypothetical protein
MQIRLHNAWRRSSKIILRPIRIGREFVKCAGLPAIIQDMIKHPEANKIQYHGCGALHTLPNNKALKPAILKKGNLTQRL